MLLTALGHGDIDSMHDSKVPNLRLKDHIQHNWSGTEGSQNILNKWRGSELQIFPFCLLESKLLVTES
jgi:hypothetical protein